MEPTDLECSELVWFLELVTPQLLSFSCCYLENHYQLFWNLFLKHDDCFLRCVLKGVFWNSSFCFTNVIIITRCFRTFPKINYIMSVLKLSFVLNIETWTKFVTIKRNFCIFMLLGNNLFIVFSNWLITCFPFLLWHSIIEGVFCHYVFQLLFGY